MASSVMETVGLCSALSVALASATDLPVVAIGWNGGAAVQSMSVKGRMPQLLQLDGDAGLW